ncbi:MAG: VOC family protein [Pseudomonadales bacterium]
MPSPGGGWNRYLLDFDDLESVVQSLKANGVKFRNYILDGVGGRQIICEDPFGSVIELTQAPS